MFVIMYQKSRSIIFLIFLLFSLQIFVLLFKVLGSLLFSKRSLHTTKLIQVNIFFQKYFTKMDGTPPDPDGKKRVITEEVSTTTTTTTTKRTIVEDSEATGASQLGIYNRLGK